MLCSRLTLVAVAMISAGLIPASVGQVAMASASAFTVSASLVPAEVVLGESAVLTGFVRPVRMGTKVRIQRKKPSGWVTIAERSMNEDGFYRKELTPARLGNYLYRARMPRVGAIAAANSPSRQLTVVDDGIAEFTIPAGTGAGSWNTSENPVTAEVGDTLRLINGDSVPHRLHTDGQPFPHPAVDLGPGGDEEYVVGEGFAGPSLYCHVHGSTAKFYFTVTNPAP